MDPRAERNVAEQHRVDHPKQRAWVHELLVERERLADAVQVGGVSVRSDRFADRAEVGADRERLLIGGR